jgi:hypothetical protein
MRRLYTALQPVENRSNLQSQVEQLGREHQCGSEMNGNALDIWTDGLMKHEYQIGMAISESPVVTRPAMYHRGQ